MAIQYKTQTIAIDFNSTTPLSISMMRADAVKWTFTFGDYDISGATKLRVFAYMTGSNYYAFGGEFDKTNTDWIATFTSTSTAGYNGAAVMTVQLTDGTDVINSANVNLLIFDSKSKIPFTPSEDFYDACMGAKADAEAAATTAIAKASEAGESASAASTSADSASISAQDANNAKNTAVEAKDAAGAYAGDCAGYAATASTKATEATTAANFASEVSRIAIVPIAGTTQTIAPNKCYTLLTNDVDAYTLTPEMPSGNPEYLLQAVVQLKTGSAAPVINWGGNPSFFNGKIPTINANSSYDVIFEFDNLTLSWTVGVMKK